MEAKAEEPKRLSLDDKLKVAYCIADWLKVEQIKANTQKVKGRIAAVYELNREPIALVNYGPSLNDTWEKIREFKYVMTCSGAHKFCVERDRKSTRLNSSHRCISYAV